MLAFSNYLKEHAPKQYNAIKEMAVTDPNNQINLAKLAINYILFLPCSKKTREELYEIEKNTRKMFYCRACSWCNAPEIFMLSSIRYNHLNKDNPYGEENDYGVENIADEENAEVLEQTFCSCKTLQTNLSQYRMGHITLQKKKDLFYAKNDYSAVDISYCWYLEHTTPKTYCLIAAHLRNLFLSQMIAPKYEWDDIPLVFGCENCLKKLSRFGQTILTKLLTTTG